ncbi:cell division cycle protein 27 homolog isoform X2 [Dermacentor andersoni]|uniref:cell division cycle protein 27 homolog isoform X2 n=1 Tax=Dermacentor andersoni TaxID=34620 RepID=UPI002155CDCE|nr:cell division cycle protein 27 homolog isoform X2 [Dermacentor andersoni]
MIVQEPVQAAIWHCLNHYAFSDAIFLAERLYAEVHTEESLHLLATCHYRAGNKVSAYMLLRSRGCRSPQSRFLLARCCIDLRKFAEAESALDADVGLASRCSAKGGLDETVTTFGDSASFALALLGQLCSKTERVSRATEAFKKSLKLNPFLWSSYESLINLGESPNPTDIFNVSSLENFSLCQGSNPLVNFVNKTNIDSITDDIKVLGGQGGGPGGQVAGKVSVLPLSAGSTPPSQAPLLVMRSTVTTSTPQQSCPDTTPLGIMTSTPELLAPESITSLCLGSKSSKQMQPLSAVKGARSIFAGGPGALSPLSASFGVLPLSNSTPGTVPPTAISGMLAYVTPTSQGILDTISKEACPPVKKNLARKPQGLNTPKIQIFSQSSNNNLLQTPPVPTSFPPSGLSSVRRSSRLFSSSNSVKENNKGSSSPKTIRGLAARLPSSKKSKPSRGALRTNTATSGSNNTGGINEGELNEMNKPEPLPVSLAQTALCMQRASAEGLMQLLQDLGKARLYLGQYRCRQAIETLEALQPHQYSTGWVLAALGRAHFELGEYDKAARAFETLRSIEPHRLQGLEYYSTALWHLQREVSLSALAQDMMDLDKTAPETCCAAGNCFSLQREHETAVRFLQRAVQADPDFVYAYTLLGHELTAMEEMEQALSAFRSAMLVNPRHYNAWYGAGMIYYKQEQFHLAELHFKRALQINPQSSVLLCHVAVVQHSLKRTEESILTLNRAISMEPRNPLCKFQRATIFFSVDRYQEALKELDELKQLVPKESLVYFLSGKVHKKLGNTHLALMNFSWAMDLDPKGANNQIKESIDKRFSHDEEDIAAVQQLSVDDSGSIESNPIDPESSHGSSVADLNDMQLQSMESDEGF